MKHARLLLAALALSLLCPALALGDEEKKESSSPDSSYFISLRLRWWMPVLNGTYQINKNDIKGSYNDFVDDLDLRASSLDPTTNKGGPEVNLSLKVMGFHFGLNYVTFNTGGRTKLEERLQIDVTEFDPDDLIKTDLTLAFGRFDVRYDLITSDLIRFGASLGIEYFDFTTSIIGFDSSAGTNVEITDAGNGLFPILGVQSGLSVSMFEAKGELYGIAGDFAAFGDIRLALIDLTLSGHLRPVKYFSFGLGFRVTHLDSSAVNIWHGDPDPVRMTLMGFFFEIEGRF
jgi:hypothetical protein